uniref:Uncharacterized protein n=1 Tax=Megaselia scalaris TaxID=36166 RepID=T1H3S1_MEGSC
MNCSVTHIMHQRISARPPANNPQLLSYILCGFWPPHDSSKLLPLSFYPFRVRAQCRIYLLCFVSGEECVINQLDSEEFKAKQLKLNFKFFIKVA